MCLFTRYVMIIAVPLASKKATEVAEALFTHACIRSTRSTRLRPLG
jgi:hypothetical protein